MLWSLQRSALLSAAGARLSGTSVSDLRSSSTPLPHSYPLLSTTVDLNKLMTEGMHHAVPVPIIKDPILIKHGAPPPSRCGSRLSVSVSHFAYTEPVNVWPSLDKASALSPLTLQSRGTGTGRDALVSPSPKYSSADTGIVSTLGANSTRKRRMPPVTSGGISPAAAQYLSPSSLSAGGLVSPASSFSPQPQPHSGVSSGSLLRATGASAMAPTSSVKTVSPSSFRPHKRHY